MAEASKVVLIRDNPYKEPYTPEGILLDQEALPQLRIHEYGWSVQDAGWCHRDVRSPFWRMYYNLDPGASITAGTRIWPLGPEAVVLIPEDTRYHCVAGVGARHFWVHFSLSGLDATPVPLTIPLSSVSRGAWREFHELIANTAAPLDPSWARFACGGQILGLLGQAQRDGEIRQISPRLQSLHAWYEGRITTPPDVEAMARQVGMGKRTFIRWFKAETGASPAAYFLQRRLREACRRLRFGRETIEEIASATGFADRHHFSRVFAAQIGVGPATYRRPRFR